MFDTIIALQCIKLEGFFIPLLEPVLTRQLKKNVTNMSQVPILVEFGEY